MQAAKGEKLTTCLFLGPTLSTAEAAEIIRADILPPVALGDVLRAMEAGYRTIVLVDGFFHGRLAVWHKEIMCALAHGCSVVGCSSMGALRAAELADYGMRGLGEIFDQYREGLLDGDDEVAVAHADESAGYRCFSEPLVNIRYGIGRAVAEGLLTEATAKAVLAETKALFYPDRHWEQVFRAVERASGNGAEPASVRAYVAAVDTDLKRKDAMRTLNWVAEGGHLLAPRSLKKFVFEETYSWQLLRMAETGR